MSDINQDDIDKLLQDALVGGGSDAAPAPAADESERGAASQDDIDALFAAVGGGDIAPAPAPKPAPSAPPPTPPAPAESEPSFEGAANQDDIDALFASVGGAGTLPPDPEPEPAGDPNLEGVAGQDDIDALFAAVSAATTPAPAAAPDEPPPVGDTETGEHGSVSQDDIETLFANGVAGREEGAGSAPGTDTAELDALLSSIADVKADVDARMSASANPDAWGDTTVAADGDTDVIAKDQAKRDTAEVGDIDMDALLKQVTDAAPPPPPVPLAKPAAPPEPQPNAETLVLDMNSPAVHQVLAAAAPAQPPPPPAPPRPMAPPPPPAAYPSGAESRQEYSALHGAGEVESIANQIGGLVGTLSEKAHRYMQAWMAAEAEARELRSRALAEERRRASLASEKDVLSRELGELRMRVGELEGGKLAWDEARRTLETSFQAKIRELESQVKLLGSEAESLKNELTRARNQATGVDIESRRARFEVDRLKNEAESERMERLRIQRALENREKEIQAMQSQSAGQASSLFIDELHRLVRRLESELDSRSSGAHEALKQVDRLDVSEDMVPVVANLRAALMQAVGAGDDPDDALKALGREAAGVKGPAAIAPGKAEILSFETALSTYNLVGAVDVAGTLLREAKATPSLLMRKIYQCPALRRPEIADYLGDLARLLEGLRTVQESTDRARGKESGESEVFYVQLFDFLHNLVRLKLINRLSGDIWRLFLDLRGRFSFVTSDKQWAEYRDSALNDKNVKA